MHDPGAPCRFCRHELDVHNSVVGCRHCMCVASPREARPRTGAELDYRVLTSTETLHMYRPGRRRLKED